MYLPLSNTLAILEATLVQKSAIQGPTGRGFQLRDGSGSGIGKNISGWIGYGLGTGIFIIYLINRVLSGSVNLDRVSLGISLRHIYLMVPDGFQWAPMVLIVADIC